MKTIIVLVRLFPLFDFAIYYIPLAQGLAQRYSLTYSISCFALFCFANCSTISELATRWHL